MLILDRTVRLLGQGTFGKVVEAVDTQTNNRVAIKIIRAIPKYRDASKIEVRVLQKLKERDPLNRQWVLFNSFYSFADSFHCSKCIHLLHWFDHRNHICLVSELLGMCVYDFLKENEFAPFPRQHIQSFARQLLGSVACGCLFAPLSFLYWTWRQFLVLHDLHLIHTDLKPENILLVHNDHKVVHVAVPGKVYIIFLCLLHLDLIVDISVCLPAQRAAQTQAAIAFDRHPTDRFRLCNFWARVPLHGRVYPPLPCSRDYPRFVPLLFHGVPYLSVPFVRLGLVLSLRCILIGMYPRGILHWHRTFSNAR